MVRRIIHQPHMEVVLVDKIDHPLHTLGAPALILWAIIQMNDQCGDMGEPLADGLPPLGEAIPQAVTGHFRGHTVQKTVRPT